MTQSSTTTETATTKPAFAALTANEWGQITDLEPHATYFVVKRPALPANGNGSTKAKELVGEAKSFLHEHKVLTQKQLQELKERYGNPVDKAREVRELVEKKFDEVARELEARYEKLENDIETNLDRILKREKSESDAKPTGTTDAETPGELPRGDANGSTESNKSGKKKAAAKKAE